MSLQSERCGNVHKRRQLPFDCTLKRISSQLSKIFITHFNIIIPSKHRYHWLRSYSLVIETSYTHLISPGVLHDRPSSYFLYIYHCSWRATWSSLFIILYFNFLIFVQEHKFYRFSLSNFLQSLSLPLARGQSAIFWHPQFVIVSTAGQSADRCQHVTAVLLKTSLLIATLSGCGR